MELPAQILAHLDLVQDFTLNFDQLGFYAVVEHVRNSPHAPGDAQTPIGVDDWRRLLEQPEAFRGCAVTISGRVGRNKDPYVLPRFPELGQLGQIELQRDDMPLTCTAICTGDVTDVPVGATVELAGYFIMIRQYHGAAGRLHQAALLVTPGVSSITRAVPAASVSASAGRILWGFIGAAIVGVVITIVLLRRARVWGRHDVHTLRSSRPAPLNLADDLADWAGREGAGEREPNDH